MHRNAFPPWHDAPDLGHRGFVRLPCAADAGRFRAYRTPAERGPGGIVVDLIGVDVDSTKQRLRLLPTRDLKRVVDLWLVAATKGDHAETKAAMDCWHTALDILDERAEMEGTGR